MYILNSIYEITKHGVTWALRWFCSDRAMGCPKWTLSLQRFNSWLGIVPPSPTLSIYTRDCVWETRTESFSSAHSVCVSERM